MSAKSKKSGKVPSWFEVGLGAVLSVVLGVALGVAYLVSKPVLKVAEIPKDAPPGAVYFIEGARDSNKAAEINTKRKALVAGQSVAVEEGELNAFFSSASKPSAPAPAPAAAKPGDKGAPAPSQKTFETGAFNARIHGGNIQFSDTVSFDVYGVAGSVIVQARGHFRKSGSVFEFDPDEIYVGGLPVQRFLFVRGWIMNKLLFTQPVPEDIAAAWSKLADVTIDGSTLRLKMP